MNKFLIFVGILAYACILSSCRLGDDSKTSQKIDSAFIERLIKDAPALSPEEALQSMVVEDGFEVKLVAAEPNVSSPVALNFDEQGRIWVVEMEGYMPDYEGSGEEVPNGKIVILSDKDNDGIIDERKVFLDSLLLPRALCLIEDGILVAEPPYLWYVEIKNDKAGKKMLVDSNYTEGGNVEAQSNGLYRAMDNWIYSGGSHKRYRKKGDKWLTEPTHLRGQWGISQDDYGRLFYNNNSQNLLGDYFPAGLGSNNSNQRRVLGYNEKIVEDRRVFPIRPTPGVNRGYQENVLDDSLRLKTFTAGSGPVIYRGDLFGKDYYNNAFVGEPAANLIKRNIIKQSGNTFSGEPAYEDKEFLVSYDERFRPVTMYNGPDGALYIVDMYRGIIQHKLFLTEYLKQEINKRSLEKPINRGRIYKVVPKNQKASFTKIPDDPKSLVDLLDHDNGWIRDKVQQTIVDRKLLAAVPFLKKRLSKQDQPVQLIHALWTLEGLDALAGKDVLPLLKAKDQQIRLQALTVLPAVLNVNNQTAFVSVLQEMITKKDSIAAPYIAFLGESVSKVNPNASDIILLSLAKTYPHDQYVVDAIISNLENKEAKFFKAFASKNADTSLLMSKSLQKILVDIKNNKNNEGVDKLRKKYPRGVSRFQRTCQPCHGVDGNGIEFLAPPLNNSDWVTGDKNRLIAVVLYGLRGPIKVNGKLYDKISGEMPGLASNVDMVDEDIAQILSFVRNSWSNSASDISREEVIKIRKKFKDRQTAFTAEELDSF